jgi:uncharacterized protein (TIGR02597 family)
MLMLNTTTRLMKSPSLILAFASLALGSAAAVAQSVTTDPVGFTTLTIKGNSFSVVGLNMVKPVAYQGVVSGVSGATVTDANANFDTALTAGKKYFVEIISGEYAGLNAEVLSWSGNSITIAGDVGAIAAALDGAGHRIRESWTIADVFGATNQAGLQGAATGDNADLIYTLDSAGNFVTYYYKNAGFVGGTGWRTLTDLSTEQGGRPLYFTDAMVVQRRAATDLSLKLVGAVKVGRTIVPVQPGVNLIANVYPVTDINLSNSGFYEAGANSLTGAATADGADLVYMLNNGVFSTFYYKNAGFVGGTGWRAIDNLSDDRGGQALAIGSGVVIERRGTSPTNVILQPTF